MCFGGAQFGILEIWQARNMNLKVRSLGSIIFVRKVFRDRSIMSAHELRKKPSMDKLRPDVRTQVRQ